MITNNEGRVMEILIREPNKAFTLQELTEAYFTLENRATPRVVSCLVNSLVKKELAQRGHKEISIVTVGGSTKTEKAIQLARGIDHNDFEIKNK